VNGELLRLTVYSGERERAGEGLLGDALFDDFDRHDVHTSVLLRGVEGFGLRHHLRTDRLLTLSEDLPLVAVALDERARIEAVLEELPGPVGRGLVTLEPAQTSLGPEGGDVKLTVYLHRHQRVAGAPAFAVACDVLHRHGVAGATALLGVDGTVEGSRRRARFLSANADVPMMVVAVGDAEPIAGALDELDRSLGTPLTTFEPVRVCKRDGETLAHPGGEGLQRLTLYSSESATVGGHAVHHELIRRLRQEGARGATSLRGIWGYHGDHAPHGDRLLQLRRRAPIITTVVDEADRVAAWFEIADELTSERGLVTAEPVEVPRYEKVGPPDPDPERKA
jgi:PII-like signaling protein